MRLKVSVSNCIWQYSVMAEQNLPILPPVRCHHVRCHHPHFFIFTQFFGVFFFNEIGNVTPYRQETREGLQLHIEKERKFTKYIFIPRGGEASVRVTKQVWKECQSIWQMTNTLKQPQTMTAGVQAKPAGWGNKGKMFLALLYFNVIQRFERNGKHFI